MLIFLVDFMNPISPFGNCFLSEAIACLTMTCTYGLERIPFL